MIFIPTKLDILHQRHQRLYLLWGKTLELFQDVCIIIQLKESRVEIHLPGKREGIDIAVSDIAVYRVFHTLDKPAAHFLLSTGVKASAILNPLPGY